MRYINKKKLILLFCLLSFLLNTQSIFSQSDNIPSFVQLTKKNGLPSNTVYQITKDDNGFIWIATNDGLVRFDGVNQRIYQNDPQQKNSISSNRVRSVLHDNDGQLWVGTIGAGLNIYDNASDNFTSFLSDQNDSTTLSNNDILCIFQDTKNQIWVGTEQGLNLFNPADKSFRRFLPDVDNPKSIGANAVLKIFEDSKGRIWIGTWDGGLNLVIPEENNNFSFLPLKKDASNPSSITSNHIWDFAEDNNNQIWLATFDGGLVTFDMPKGELKNLKAVDFKFTAYNKALGQFENNRIFTLAKDNIGDIWVGTSVGLAVFSPNDLKTTDVESTTPIFHTYLLARNDNNSLPHNEIRDLFFDNKKEIIWASTFGGIGYHFMSQKKFNIFQSPLPSEAVSMLIQSKQKDIQYLGLFSKGLIEYNTQTKTFKNFRHSSNNLNYDRILSIAEFGESVWIGSQAGLSIFDKKTKKLKIVENLIDLENVTDFSIIKFYQDSKKRIWLTTTIGLIQTDLSLSNIKLHQPDNNNINAISDELVADIEEDKDGNLWVVTCGGGLNKLTFNDKGEAIFKSLNSDNRADNKPATDLLYFAEIESNNKVIWLGSEVGLIKYMIETDEFINDLPFGNSRTFGLGMVNDNVWLSDSDGITRYDTKSDRVSTYNTADGLQSGGFLHYAHFHDKISDFLFFGGADGYQYFNPNEVIQDDDLQPLLITDFKIFNKSVGVNETDELTNSVILTQNITNTNSLRLSYLHTSISFSVTPLDYEHANRYLFAYKLEGLEKEWQYTTNTQINYSRLPHGSYNLLVKAQNSDGFWSPETKLKITIVPPFWKRLDFIIFMSLLVLFSIAWFIYSKIKQVNLEKENLENLVLDASTALPSEIQESLSTEDILRENKIFFEKLYFESPLGIAFTDGNFNVIKYNDKFTSVFQNETIQDRQIFDFITSERQNHYQSLVHSLTKKQEKTFRQDIPYTINEQEVWLNTAFSFLYDNNNDLRYAIIKVSDVTERKKQEKKIQSLVKEIQGKNEELEQKVAIRTEDLELTNNELTIKNEELARFAYIASHDLKEPLRNISSFVGLINRRIKKDTLSPEIIEYLKFIKLNTHQMHTIITDVLEYSKFDKNEFSVEAVDLNKLFEEVQLTLSSFIEESNAQLIIPTFPILNSNRGFLFLLLKNIIGNGIKYNESDIPTIEISYQEDATQFIISIKDNGIGIEPQYHDLIFTMFKRLHTREKYKGSGLGLALCKRIVEKINGKLELESALGEGSTFVIYHPKY